MSDEWLWWSNKIEASQNALTKEVFQRALQKVTICAFCGLTVQATDPAYAVPEIGGIRHKTCPPVTP